MCDYNEHVIVAQNELQIGASACIQNAFWKTYSSTVDRIIVNPQMGDHRTTKKLQSVAVECKFLVSDSEALPAEVLFVAYQDVLKKVQDNFYLDHSVTYNQKNSVTRCTSVVIRILDSKAKYEEEFEKRWASDVTFLINDGKCQGDRHYLAAISPVFKRMLFGQFMEAQQREIVLKEIESVDIFKDFLLAISPLRVQPNPTNVAGILKLAHRFDIPFMINDCENHLKYCYEMDVSERIGLAGKFDLKALKLHIMQNLNDDDFEYLLAENWKNIRSLGADLLTSGMFIRKK
ncbi:BTB/POZ domain-containing protein [Ditylenchus destructor]|nr:BTB/POZ domain-containing protein [Ditylenchus destructor]